MSDYSSKKVAELKELLSARGLTVSGNKAELVARLEEADKATTDDTSKAGEAVASTEPAVSESAAEPAAVPAAEPTAAEPATASEPIAAEPVAAAEPTTASDDVVEAGATDEEKKNQAIEDLEKQIKRKKRFGTGDNDEEIAELEKQLDRIKRFGYTASESANNLSFDRDLDSFGKRRQGRSGKAKRESAASKEKGAAHPYKKDNNGLKPGVQIAVVDEEKLKARQARFAQ